MGGLAAAVVLDQKVGEYIGGGTRPEVVFYNTRNASRFPNIAWVSFGGFNVEEPLRINQALAPTFDRFGQSATIHYSSNGLQIEDMVRALAEASEKRGIDTFYFYGHSMGGMVATEVAAGLIKNGFQVPFLALDCTPHDFSDVRGVVARLGLSVAAEAERYSLHGGPATHAIFESLTRIYNDPLMNEQQLVAAIKDSIRSSSPSHPSNSLVQSQALFMRQFDANRFIMPLSSTQVAHLAPTYAFQDQVVYDDRARIGWQECYDQPTLGTTLLCLNSPKTGHADPSDHPHAYNAMLLEACISAGLPTEKTVRTLGGWGLGGRSSYLG